MNASTLTEGAAVRITSGPYRGFTGRIVDEVGGYFNIALDRTFGQQTLCERRQIVVCPGEPAKRFMRTT